jgi:hypothetical protein
MKISEYYAYIKLPFFIVILNEESRGNKCTVEASENLKKSKSGHDVYQARVGNDILWVSEREFKSHNLTEIPAI